MKADHTTHLTEKQLRRLVDYVFAVPSEGVGGHLKDSDCSAYAQETLSHAEMHRIDQHLSSCPECAVKMERFHADGATRQEGTKVTRMTEGAQPGLGSPSALPGIEPEAVEALLDRLRHDDVSVRCGAAVLAGRLGSDAATPAILAALSQLMQDEDERVRRSAAQAVGRMGDASVLQGLLPDLRRLMGDVEATVRGAAVAAVRRIGTVAATQNVLGRVRDLTDDENPVVRAEAEQAYQQLRNLRPRIKEPPAVLRMSANAAVLEHKTLETRFGPLDCYKVPAKGKSSDLVLQFSSHAVEALDGKWVEVSVGGWSRKRKLKRFDDQVMAELVIAEDDRKRFPPDARITIGVIDDGSD